jgi:hypothetical protein
MKHVTVQIYENGRVISNFHDYPQYKLIPLMRSINDLWTVSKNSIYWFETELYESSGSCITRRKPQSILRVTCYRESLNSSEFKMRAQIPGKYIKRMLGTRHRLYPEQIGYTPWPGNLEVKFVLIE